MKRKIEFYRHNLTPADKKECRKVLDSLFLTTGNVVTEFERKFANYLGARYAIAVASCTDALFLCLKGIGIKPGDEVITTPMSFIATANAIEHCGAKPVFVDVEPATGNINADLIEKAITRNTKAIIPVHLYGHMVDMKKIHAVAKKHNLKVIEDCAHCIEGERDGVRPGQLSNAACFSFYATKNITSGEGGAIATNDKKLGEWLTKARLHGMSKHAVDRYTKKYEHYDMEFLGYKANMNNIQASLLLHQLENIETYLVKKEAIAKMYTTHLQNNPGIKLPAILPKIKHARHIYTLWFDPAKRDAYMLALQDAGIGIGVHFLPIHLMTYYKRKYGYKKGIYPNAEKIGASTITIPMYPKLKKEEIQYIIKTVTKITKS